MSKLWELESALTESQGITRDAKYIDTLDIQSKLANLAEKHGLAEEMDEEVEHHIQCDTIEECFDRVMQTSVSRFGEVLVMSVVEQLWNEYCYESRH